MERWWNYTDRRKRAQSEKTLSHFFHHKSHTDWRGFRTLDSALKFRWLPPWAITEPSSGCERCVVKLLKIKNRGLFQNISVASFMLEWPCIVRSSYNKPTRCHCNLKFISWLIELFSSLCYRQTPHAVIGNIVLLMMGMMPETRWGSINHEINFRLQWHVVGLFLLDFRSSFLDAASISTERHSASEKTTNQRTPQMWDIIWTPTSEFQLTIKVNAQEYFRWLWVRRFFLKLHIMAAVLFSEEAVEVAAVILLIDSLNYIPSPSLCHLRAAQWSLLQNTATFKIRKRLSDNVNELLRV